MSLKDLMALARHYWWAFVLLPLMGAGLMLAWALCFSSHSYSATAVLEASDPSGSVSVSTLASTVSPVAKKNASANMEGAHVSVTENVAAGSGVQTFSFTATGADPEVCVSAANDAANQTADQTSRLFQEMNDLVQGDAERDIEQKIETLETLGSTDSAEVIIDLLETYTVATRKYEFCSFSVLEATKATSGGRGALDLSILGLLCGLVAAAVLVIAVDFARSPIKSPRDVKTFTDLPVLTFPFPRSNADYLWSNIKHSQKRPLSRVAVVPLKHSFSEHSVAAIKGAAERDGLHVELVNPSRGCLERGGMLGDNKLELFQCEPLTEDVLGAEMASGCDATVIVATAWRDSTTELQEAIEELEMSDANIAGVALDSGACRDHSERRR